MTAGPSPPPHRPTPVSRERALAQLAQDFDDNAALIQRALDRDVHGNTLEDIRGWVMDGTMQLWCGEGFVGVTEVVDYPHMKVLVVCLAAGNKDAVIGAYQGKIEPFAKAIGAQAVEIQGREGWARELRHHGFKQSSVTLFREV